MRLNQHHSVCQCESVYQRDSVSSQTDKETSTLSSRSQVEAFRLLVLRRKEDTTKMQLNKT